MIKLFGSYTSPFVRHCRIALMETNIPFEFVIADYAMTAERSPTKKMPFLETQSDLLSDSTSILHWIRNEANAGFNQTVGETELYTLANTVLDTAINLYLLEKEGFTPGNIPYLSRQQNRIESSLKALENLTPSSSETFNDAHWRLACLLDWATYRNRFQINSYQNLTNFHQTALANPHFQQTAPPPL